VEFVRINPKLYWGMSNAQVAALGSIVAGLALIAVARAKNVQWAPEIAEESKA
jgi:phosphatidylglycerol:prolipoprotein diacylglycerol transferase